jgi:predicted alpha/beta superfamily hydrolase
VGKTFLGKGQGKNYIKFISETLKPFVDNQFRTKPEREFTGIGGSSLGGLISIFCGLMYPKMYGKLMVFSPSLWVSPKLIIDGDNENNEDTKIYLYAGGDESENLVEQVKNFKNKLKANELVKDKMKINISINMEGKHNESYWSDEFPKAIEWLYFNTKAS